MIEKPDWEIENCTKEFYKKDNADDKYNCLSYVIGDETKKYGTGQTLYPQEPNPNYPNITPPTDVVKEFKKHPATKDYTVIYENKPSNIKNCIVVYGHSATNIIHYAKMVNGLVYAKLGEMELVIHRDYDAYLPTSNYGSFIAFVVNPNESQ